MKTTIKQIRIKANLSDCVAFNLKKASRRITRIYDDALRLTGLRSTQFSALAVLSLLGSQSITELAENLGTERTTLTRNLKLLHESKYISIQSAKDPRSKMVTITSKGKKIFNKALPIWEVTQEKMIKNIGTDNWKIMTNSLNKLTRLK